jgi:hypothetical protein
MLPETPMSRSQKQPKKRSADLAPAALAERAFAEQPALQVSEIQTQPGQAQASPQANHSIAAAPVRLSTGQLLQPKLKLGVPDDPFEQEAERVAQQVMRAPVAPAAQTPPRIQRAAAGDAGSELAPEVEAGIAGLTGGQPLDATTRSSMEPRFGHDFSQVRVHSYTRAGDLAGRLQARAFTVGNNLAFAPGQYEPGSSEGQRLLAHELTHVVQQGQGVVRRDPDDTEAKVDPQIMIGSTGDAVRKAQELLNKHGATPPLNVDGIFGPKTLSATRSFQKGCKLTADGIIGPKTWGELNKAPTPRTGLASDESVANFAGAAGSIQDNWAKLTPQQRADDLVSKVNAELRSAGAYPVKAVLSDSLDAGTEGEFDFETWSLSLNKARFEAATITNAQMADVVNTVYHESRHAEQWFRMAQKLAGEGKSAQEIAGEMFIPPEVAEAAVKSPLKALTNAERSGMSEEDAAMHDQRLKEGNEWHASVYGAGSGHRNAVLSDTGNRYAEYRALPEEKDAWSVGDRAGDVYKQGQAKKKK